MIKNIVIIGGGWYGCYAALLLQDTQTVILIEKASNIFENASYYNQNRLHIGYHYVRSYKTRNLCKKGFFKFIDKFSSENIINKIDNNLYLISVNSIVDYETINSIYKYENYEYNIIKNTLFKTVNKNILQVNECVINSEKAKQFFINNLKCKKLFDKKIIKINSTNNIQQIIFDNNDIQDTDFIKDCTYNSLNLSSSSI